MAAILTRPQCVNNVWSPCPFGMHAVLSVKPLVYCLIERHCWGSTWPGIRGLGNCNEELYFTFITELTLNYRLTLKLVVVSSFFWYFCTLTHWGLVMHICVSEQAIIGSDNGLSPGQCQAIFWTSAEILLIRTSGRNFSEILSEIHIFSLKNMHLKMSSAKWWPFCLNLNVLTCCIFHTWFNSKGDNFKYIFLTHWGRDEMAAISQMTVSNAFSWMKMYEFWLKFHWSVFLSDQLTIFQDWFQIMVWHWSGIKPVSEPMMVRLFTHICVTQPQWVKWNFSLLLLNTICADIMLNELTWWFLSVEPLRTKFIEIQNKAQPQPFFLVIIVVIRYQGFLFNITIEFWGKQHWFHWFHIFIIISCLRSQFHAWN